MNAWKDSEKKGLRRFTKWFELGLDRKLDGLKDFSEGEVFGSREERNLLREREKYELWIVSHPLIENAAWWMEIFVENLSSTKSGQKRIYQGSVKNLLTTKGWSRWIEDLSRIYWEDREHRKNSQWIEKLLRILSRLEVESSIGICRGCVKKLLSLKKEGFLRREKHIEMNATNKLLKQTSKPYIKLSNLISNKMQSIHRSNNTHTHTHTHTHKTSLTYFIFQKQVKIV